MPSFTPASKSKKLVNIDYFDFFWIFISPFLALALRGREFIFPVNSYYGIPETYYFAIIFIVSSLPVFLFFRISNSLHHLFSVKDIISIFIATILSILIGTYANFFLNRMGNIPRSVPLIYGALLIIGLTSYRVIIRIFETNREGRSKSQDEFFEVTNFRRVIIIGLDHFSINTIRLTEAQYPRVIQVMAAFSPTNKLIGRSIGGVTILGNLSTISNVIAEYRVHGVKIDEIWLSDNLEKITNNDLNYISNASEAHSIPFKMISEALNLTPENNFQWLEKKKAYKKIILDNKYFNYKRVMDLVGSLILSFMLIPIITIASVAVIFDVGPPIFFWQERLGRYGNKFLVYKIRTLSIPKINDNSSEIIAGQVTIIGRFLRFLRIDELPQILNVIVGEMSLVGPRPLLAGDQPVDPSIRLLIRPGLTGWAQVNGGEYLDIEDKNLLDCWYVFNASFFLDIKILLRTIHVLIFGASINHDAIHEAGFWVQENSALILKYSKQKQEESVFF